jgi:hypothetical protein
MQIEIDDGSMCQAMTKDSVHNADMHVVDPAEARRVRCGAVVSRRADGHKGPPRPFWSKDRIHSVAYTA